MSNNLHKILEQYWGYSSFRPLQEDIINSILASTDTLALLPTGGGKSICFQVPAMAQDGICIVVSPLVALMKDQVENLQKKGISAYHLHAALGKREIDIALDNCIYGKVKFLYVSPERLKTDIFLERFKKMQVSFIAIDEAHCISEWGYDFRPPYLEIAQLRQLKPQIPFLALTASATEKVQDDIKEKLAFSANSNTFKKSFDRPNLVYAITETEDKYGRILYALNKTPGTAIIYVRNRRQTKEISEWLNSQKISATFYHAGLSVEQRNQRQEMWLSDKVRVIVATNAFGMGIDKPNVRLVIHFALPESLEAYYQEAGRAGRDGLKAFAIAMVSEKDLAQLTNYFKQQFPEVSAIINTYHALGNYLQLPLEAGFGRSFDFDLNNFCQVYNFKPLDVVVHLKLLQQSGYLETNEALNERSKVFILMPYQEVYKFMVSSQRLEPVLKTLLRMHGNLFDDYAPISENKLSKALSLDPSEVVKRLQELQKFKVIDYLHHSGKPQIVYTLPRHDKNQIRLDRDFLEKRKKVLKDKLDAIMAFATEKNACRGNIILHYFNESTKGNCGHCDYCLKQAQQPDEMFDKIKSAIGPNGLSLDALKMRFNTQNEVFRNTFRYMIDNRLIELKDEMVYHCSKN